MSRESEGGDTVTPPRTKRQIIEAALKRIKDLPSNGPVTAPTEKDVQALEEFQSVALAAQDKTKDQA